MALHDNEIKRPLELPEDMLVVSLYQLTDAAAIAAHLAAATKYKDLTSRLRRAAEVFEEMRQEVAKGSKKLARHMASVSGGNGASGKNDSGN